MDNRLYGLAKWRSRRGMLELDTFLFSFAKDIFPTLDDDQQKLYIHLLEYEDLQLFDWLTGKKSPPILQLSLIKQIRLYKKNKIIF